MRAAIHQLQYWPGLRFFAKMRRAELFIYLDDVQFEKREFQNRNRVRTPRGWQYLTAPVVSKGRFSQRINEVELDNSSDWRADHLQAIKLNYARAPFFKAHLPALEALYGRDYRLLADLAIATMDFLKEGFDVKTPVKFSSEFGVREASSARLARLCAAAGADEYLSGAGAKAYLDPNVFSYAGIKLAWQEFEPREYPQAFPGFEPDMSALDLLLNCGPRSTEWI
ncbi:MAG: WbqC family protein [Elusimicrobia bacterium]|nr:WbqC family protein [Elusimicrobiota bacterium]